MPPAATSLGRRSRIGQEQLGGSAPTRVGAELCVETIFVTTSHVTKDGKPKLVERCTCPLTAVGVVSRIYTDLAVIETVAASPTSTASQEFLQTLRDWTREDGALLLFDEVITFRTEVGGMQQRHHVKPDLTALGKMIGGGFPVGALAGNDDVMHVFARDGQAPQLPHSGTFSGNPITMTAGLTAMRMFDREAVARLNELGDHARRRLNKVIAEAGVPASVTGAGSAFRIHMKAEPPKDYRHAWPTPREKRAERKFIDALYDNGILIVATGAGFLTTPMGEEEVERLAEVVQLSLRKTWDEVHAK